MTLYRLLQIGITNVSSLLSFWVSVLCERWRYWGLIFFWWMPFLLLPLSGNTRGAGKVAHFLTTRAHEPTSAHVWAERVHFDARFCCCLLNPGGPSCSRHRGLKENHRRQLIAWQASASARQRAELTKSRSRCVLVRVFVFSSSLSVFRLKTSILHVELLLQSHSWRLLI